MNSGDIVQAINPGAVIGREGEHSYMRVAIDSRKVTGGELFFALKGASTDGHLHIDDAVRRGARGVVCEREPSGCPDAQVFLVDDSLRALCNIASWKRDLFRGKVIAITGSNGKTSTKEMMSAVLSENFCVIKSPENRNTKIGLSMTMFELSNEYDLLIVEMGTNHLGEIEEMTDLIRPHIGVITNIAPAHLEGFGSVQAILAEKGSLLRMLPSDGYALVNGDDRSLSKFAQSLDIDVWTFGLESGNDFHARDVVLDGFGRPSFLIGEQTLVRLPTIGMHNVTNSMAAVAIGFLFDLDVKKIGRGLEGVRLPSMRTELLEEGGVRFLVDCYNANPGSMKTSIRTLSRIKAKRRIAVLGLMAELGKRSRTLHLSVGEEVARRGVDILLSVGEEAGAYLEGAGKWSLRNNRAAPELLPVLDMAEAYQVLRQKLKKGDLVLFKASRAAQLEKLVDMVKSGLEEK